MGSTRMETETSFIQTYLTPLMGATVAGVEAKVEDGEVWPVIRLHHPKLGALTLEVSRDPEGNGPGWVFGLPSTHYDPATGLHSVHPDLVEALA